MDQSGRSSGAVLLRAAVLPAGRGDPGGAGNAPPHSGNGHRHRSISAWARCPARARLRKRERPDGLRARESERVRGDVPLRLRPLVAKLKEPERAGYADDRAADLFSDLAGQGVEDWLGTVPASAGKDVRAVVVEHEDRAAGPGQYRAR